MFINRISQQHFSNRVYKQGSSTWFLHRVSPKGFSTGFLCRVSPQGFPSGFVHRFLHRVSPHHRVSLTWFLQLGFSNRVSQQSNLIHNNVNQQDEHMSRTLVKNTIKFSVMHHGMWSEMLRGLITIFIN